MGYCRKAMIICCIFVASCQEIKTGPSVVLPVEKKPDYITDCKDFTYSLVFSPDGKYLITGGGVIRGHLTIWDTSNWQRTHRQETETAIWGLAVSPDGKFLVSGGSMGLVKLWQLPQGQFITSLPGHSLNFMADCIAFSPNAEFLATGGEDKTIQIRNIVKRETLIQFHFPFLEESADKEFCLRNRRQHNTGTIFQKTFPVERIYGLVFSQDSKGIFSLLGDKRTAFFNLNTGEMRTTGGKHEGTPVSLAISPNGEILATAGATDRQDKAKIEEECKINLWDLKKEKEIGVLAGHKDTAIKIVFSPDCKTLASSSHDGSIKLWNIKQMVEIKEIKTGWSYVRDVAISPNGKLLAACGGRNPPKIWDLETLLEAKKGD